MRRLTSLPTLIDAQLASDLLASTGIRNHLFNVNAVGALGEVPFAQSWPELWIDDDALLERARMLLDAARTGARGERICPRCRETNPDDYLSCWACGGAIAPD